MVRSGNRSSKAGRGVRPAAQAVKSPQTRKANRLQDEVYREMLLLESNRPGSEMGLALALLRAIVQYESLRDKRDFREWLKAVCAIGLRRIEASLAENSKCSLEVH